MPPRRTLLAALPLLCLGASAFAQPNQTVRLRGTITAMRPTSITLSTRDGETLTLKRDPNLAVTAVIPANLGDISPGSYIGVTALPQPDGTLRALEVHVFPEASRGAGEGSRPWDLAPQSTMTNGTVADVVGTEGRTVTVNYKTDEKKFAVPDNIPIVTFEPGNGFMLVPGAHVIVAAAKAADGTLTATRVSVGKDGLVPPM